MQTIVGCLVTNSCEFALWAYHKQFL